jgi:hypothetical protein
MRLLETALHLSFLAGAWFDSGPAALAQDRPEGPEQILGTFDRPEDARLWEASGGATLSFEPRDPTDLNKMAKLVAGGGSYAGLFSFRQPKDWSAYEVLSFVVWSPDRRTLGVRVDDENSRNYATRYNGDVTLEAGRNLVQIPIRDMKAVINPAKVKSMGLFAHEPPKGLVLYFDDIRLGARQTDKVAFIPYEKRLEFVPTTEVESPHFPLARPLAGGPLKALVVYDIEEGRDLSELMQRIDLQVSPVSWSREGGIQKWIGFAYGQRSYDLSRRYLASSLQGPEKFDTLLVSTPTGWGPLGKAATEPLVDRVKNRGEGLVLVFPFPGEKRDAVWPEDLKSLSALVDSESDVQREDGYVRPATSGQISGKKWRAVKDHPIVRGVPLDALPFEALDVQTYKAAPGSEVLIETETGQPVLAVREAGKGRVVTFAVRCRSLTPFVRDAGARRQWRDYRYWEVFYDLLARAALWSARRDAAREGDARPLQAKHADPRLSCRQWKNARGEVTAWALDFAPASSASIKVTAPERIACGDDLPIRFEPVPGATHRVRLVDYAGGRRRTLLEQSAEGSSATLSTRGMESLALVTEVEAVAEGRRVALGEATTYLTPSSEWNDYEVYGWSAGGISYLRDLQLLQLRRFGLSTEQVGGPENAQESFRHGFRVQAMFSSTGLHVRDFERVFREYNKSGDPKLLVRNPSFSDAAFLEDQRRKVSAWARSMAPYAPLTMSLGDETSLTSYRAEFDFDFHPENLRAFRERMRAKFGDVTAMNAALGTASASFEDLTPPVTADARKGGAWGLWNEWREHNDDLWAGTFAFYRDELRRQYPATRLSVSGTQTSHVFNGIDWAKLAPVMGAIADYTGRFQLPQRLSFNPQIRSTPWAGYGRTGPGAGHQLWSNLSFDGSGTAFFWYPSLLNADYTLSPSARDYLPTLKLLREGVGKQFLQTHRRFSPVAILWSARSQRAAWTAGNYDAFEKVEAAAYQALVQAGFDPFFISENDAAAGGLESKGVRALVLPMTIALGRGDRKGGLGLLPALLRFQGPLIATHAATHDEFLQPRALPESAAARFQKMPGTSEELAALLKGAGLLPQPGVTSADGGALASVVVSVHAFRGTEEGQILAVLRSPVGQKEEVGADGVVHLVADPKGGRPVERALLDVSRFGSRRFFDLRRRQELTPRDGRIALELPGGDCIPIAVLPDGPLDLAATAVRHGDQLTLVASGHARLPHVIRLDVIDRATGEADLLLSRNLLLDKSGRVEAELRLAVEERGRAFEVRFTDILTGASVRVSP